MSTRSQAPVIILLMLIGMLAFSPSGIQATPQRQGGGQLSFGQSVTGTITDEQFRDLYLFNGQAGQIVAITMTRDEGDLDPFLVLVDQTGQVLATNDDDGSTRNAAITAYRLTADGIYTIIATRFGHEHGSTTGTYTLRLDNLGMVTASDTSNLIRYGVSISGVINDSKPEDIYIFQAERGDVIQIHLKRTSGDLDPLLDLYFNPTDQPLITGDDDPTSEWQFNARIIYTIPADGVYYIRATRYGRHGGPSSGTYLLTLAATPPDELGTRLNNARYIEYGQTVTGLIDNAISARYFQFEAQRGDIISVFVKRESDNLSPTIVLFSQDLRQLATSQTVKDQAETRLPGVSLPDAGLYYLMISRFGGLEGATTGNFSLQLVGRPGLASAAGLEIVYGGQVSGVIDNASFATTYIFVGLAGDKVTIIMRATEGNLDTLLTLRNETGKQLAANDDGFDDGTRDSIIRFTLTEDGIFQIEASRYERINGTTSGSYLLTLDLENKEN